MALLGRPRMGTDLLASTVLLMADRLIMMALLVGTPLFGSIRIYLFIRIQSVGILILARVARVRAGLETNWVMSGRSLISDCRVLVV